MVLRPDTLLAALLALVSAVCWDCSGRGSVAMASFTSHPAPPPMPGASIPKGAEQRFKTQYGGGTQFPGGQYSPILGQSVSVPPTSTGASALLGGRTLADFGPRYSPPSIAQVNQMVKQQFAKKQSAPKRVTRPSPQVFDPRHGTNVIGPGMHGMTLREMARDPRYASASAVLPHLAKGQTVPAKGVSGQSLNITSKDGVPMRFTWHQGAWRDPRGFR